MLFGSRPLVAAGPCRLATCSHLVVEASIVRAIRPGLLRFVCETPFGMAACQTPQKDRAAAGNGSSVSSPNPPSVAASPAGVTPLGGQAVPGTPRPNAASDPTGMSKSILELRQAAPTLGVVCSKCGLRGNQTPAENKFDMKVGTSSKSTQHIACQRPACHRIRYASIFICWCRL